MIIELIKLSVYPTAYNRSNYGISELFVYTESFLKFVNIIILILFELISFVTLSRSNIDSEASTRKKSVLSFKTFSSHVKGQMTHKKHQSTKTKKVFELILKYNMLTLYSLNVCFAFHPLLNVNHALNDGKLCCVVMFNSFCILEVYLLSF